METKGKFGIVQLTRFGDLIQTYQAAKDLKNNYPNVQLVLIARKEFCSPLIFLLKQVFDEILPVDKNDLLGQENVLTDYLGNIKTFLNSPHLKDIDVLINLSFCETSNYLCSLIDAKNKLGTRVNDSNQVEVNDQWSQLVYSMVMGGPGNPFNLVDIYKNIFGLKKRKNWENTNRHVGNEFTLALHPFASQDKKRWKAQKWAEVLFKVLKDAPNIKVRVYGGKGDIEDAKTILESNSLKRFNDRIINNVGKLSFSEVFEDLKLCSHFVGHDSALGHLAKEADLATLTIALGTVRPIETAPYGINTFVLAPKTKCFPCFPDTDCSFYQCHADLSFQAAAEVIKGFVCDDDISLEKLRGTVSPFHLDSFSIYRMGPTTTGWYASENISDGTVGLGEALRDIYKVALTYKFEEIEENLTFPKINPKERARLQQIQSGLEQLYQLNEFGKKYSKDILIEVARETPDVKTIKQLGSKIEDVDQLQQLLLNAHPEVKPIVDFYRVVKSNLHGQNIVELSESSYLVYNDASVTTSLIYELVGNTIKNNGFLGKPTASTKEGNA